MTAAFNDGTLTGEQALAKAAIETPASLKTIRLPVGLLRAWLHNALGGLVVRWRFCLGLIAPSLGTVPPGLLPGMQRLRRRHHANGLALQIQTRCIFSHRSPVATATAPGGNTRLELLTGDTEQLQMLLGILENAFLQRHLGRRIDREGQGEVLLQPPDRLDGRILLAWLGFGRRLTLLRLRAFGFYLLYLLLLGAQAVT